MMRILVAGLLSIALTSGGVLSVSAQTYPAKPIRMVVGFPPGGSADVNARHFAQAMSGQLGQQIVVDNKPGAGGNIAAAEVARSKPDGYTIFYATSAIVLAPSLYSKLQYDPFKDFIPVALTANIPLLLAVNPALPVKDVKELIAYVKAKPEGINYASSGAGAILHLACAQFAKTHGLKMTHVPYKGSAPALTDVMGGQTEMICVPINEAIGHVRVNRLRALAITSTKRSPLLPETPTLAEATGVKDAEIGAWSGIVAPKGTPKEIVTRLNAEVNKALTNPELLQRLEAQGSEPLGGTPEQHEAHMKREFTRWANVIREAGIKLEE
jgi:tripartite-type tricarboxylate transporter receptor subunit TctC